MNLHPKTCMACLGCPGYRVEPCGFCGGNQAADAAPERKCAKCNSLTNGEEAWVDNQIWCHPCADSSSPLSRPEGK